MKAIILAAGSGKRSGKHGYKHKSLIKLNLKTVIERIIENLLNSGIKEITVITGFNAKYIKASFDNKEYKDNVSFFYNSKWKHGNNLLSLYEARGEINKDILIVNGDMVFSEEIIKKLIKSDKNSIAVDVNRKAQEIDSPGTIVRNNRILDLGRHINIKDNSGYAVGLYKISQDIFKSFFDVSEQLLDKDINSGFHDPLNKIFEQYFFSICDVGNDFWMDIDVIGDINIARKLLKENNSWEIS